jgi:hypothetical protein
MAPSNERKIQTGYKSERRRYSNLSIQQGVINKQLKQSSIMPRNLLSWWHK